MANWMKGLALAMSIAGLTAFLAPAAHAQSLQDEETCRNVYAEPDEIIRTCSLFIRSGRWARGGLIQNEYRWTLYALRGNAYYRSGNADKALADLDHAIELHGSDAGSFYVRAQVQKARGEWDRYLEDLRAAGRLDARYSEAAELSTNWHAYLREIQEAKDVANWEAPPLDALRRQR